MHRSPRVLAAWGIAVVVGLLTTRVVATDLGALHRRAQSLGGDVPVVLAARDLPIGTTISTDDLRVVMRPKSTIPPDALRAASDAIGRVVTRERARDDVVRGNGVASADRAGLDAVVPPGRRALHIVVKDGFRPPIGAIVDVLAASDTAAGAHHEATVVAKAARVLAVEEAGGSGGAGGSAVTLLVADSESGDLADASLNGQLTIALAPPETACCTSSGSSPER